MEVVLNIGLARAGKPNLTADAVGQAIVANDFRLETAMVAQSDTEPTVVAVVTVFDLPAIAWRKLNQIANDLGQECIAAYSPVGRSGALVGPRAAAWGEFNPEFFIMPDGTRLASPAAKAA